MNGQRGGRRRRHVPPSLSTAQVQEACQLRLRGWSVMGLARKFQVCRETMSRALHGRGAYKGTQEVLA